MNYPVGIADDNGVDYSEGDVMRRFWLIILLILTIPFYAEAATISSGGGHTIEDESSALTPRPTINFTGPGVACSDDSGNNETDCAVDIGTAPANLYVCGDTGATCNASDSNACTSPTATCLTIAGVLSKIPDVNSTNTTIHVASGSYDSGSTTVNTRDSHYAYPAIQVTETTRIYISKYFTGTNFLTVQGYINSSANQFTHSTTDSGTSSGSNTNTFPTDGTNQTETYFYDTSKAWTTNAYALYFLKITGGTGYDSTFDDSNWYVLTDNTATRLRIVGRWKNGTPDNTTTYQIYNPSNASQFLGTGVDAVMLTRGAKNIKFRNVYFGTAGTRSMKNQYSRNIQFYASRIGGANGNIESEITFEACNLDGDGKEFTVNANQLATLLLTGSRVGNFTKRGIHCVESFCLASESWVASTQTTANVGQGVYVDALGRFSSVRSRIGPHTPSGSYSVNAIRATDSHVFISDGNQLLGRDQTDDIVIDVDAGTYLEFDGTVTDNIIHTGNIGIKIRHNSSLSLYAGGYYIANQINVNRYIDESSSYGEDNIVGKYIEVTGTSYTIENNFVYIANNASLVTLTLPTYANIGDIITVQGKGAGYWRVSQNANQVLKWGGTTTTTGTGGYVDTAQQYAGMTIRCITANTTWEIVAASGTITFH